MPTLEAPSATDAMAIDVANMPSVKGWKTREWVAYLEKLGFKQTRDKKHFCFEHPVVGRFSMAKTPSDWRSAQNTKRDLRKMIRHAQEKYGRSAAPAPPKKKVDEVIILKQPTAQKKEEAVSKQPETTTITKPMIQTDADWTYCSDVGIQLKHNPGWIRKACDYLGIPIEKRLPPGKYRKGWSMPKNRVKELEEFGKKHRQVPTKRPEPAQPKQEPAQQPRTLDELPREKDGLIKLIKLSVLAPFLGRHTRFCRKALPRIGIKPVVRSTQGHARMEYLTMEQAVALQDFCKSNRWLDRHREPEQPEQLQVELPDTEQQPLGVERKAVTADEGLTIQVTLNVRQRAMFLLLDLDPGKWLQEMADRTLATEMEELRTRLLRA